jgi:hypothetical protein
MADETLQAFQLGASLYDRAQTQKRMMEQVNMQLADQQMRKENYDIQNQVASNQLATGLAEQKKFSFDLPKIQAWQSAYVQWNAKGDPTAAFPAPPTDLQSATGLKMLGDMSGPVIQSLPMAQNRFLLEKANASQMAVLNKEIDFLNENGKSDIPLQYNGGLDPKTGQINPEFRAAIFAAAAPLRQKQARLKELSTTSIAGQRNTREGLKSQLDSGAITPEEYSNLLPTARTEGGVVEQRTQKNIADLIDEGILDPNNKVDVANASRAIRSNLKTPSKIIDSVTASDSATNQLDNALQKIQAFDAKYGANAFSQYVGPVDEPFFRAEGKFKGLTSAEKQTARTIQQQIAQVVQNYRRGVFGQTLQPNEQKNMDDIVGTARGNDYVVLVGGFNDNLKSGLKRTISNYKFNADIPIDIKRTHAPEIFVSGQRQDGQSAPPTEQSMSPQDIFKNIRQNPPQGSAVQPAPARGNARIRFDAQGNTIQ